MTTTDPTTLAIHRAVCEDSIEECLDCGGMCVKAARAIPVAWHHTPEPEGVQVVNDDTDNEGEDQNRWAPTLALFYTAGRRAQQTKAVKSASKSPEPIGHIECYCGEEMPIYGDVEIIGEPGAQTATVSVDTSALWLHSFTKHPDAHKENDIEP